MKNIKRKTGFLLAVIFALGAAVGLAACGGNGDKGDDYGLVIADGAAWDSAVDYLQDALSGNGTFGRMTYRRRYPSEDSGYYSYEHWADKELVQNNAKVFLITKGKFNEWLDAEIGGSDFSNYILKQDKLAAFNATYSAAYGGGDFFDMNKDNALEFCVHINEATGAITLITYTIKRDIGGAVYFETTFGFEFN